MIYDLSDNELVLFQGDSITDAGRNKNDSSSMGTGYANMAAAMFSASHPFRRLQFVNKGISGHKVTDLEARWDADCIKLRPKLMSILVGINDAYKGMDISVYEKSYRNIVGRIRKELDCEVILIEPFLLAVGDNYMEIRGRLWQEIEVVRSLAREFACSLIAMDGMFADVSTMQEPTYWSSDGVHLTDAGNALVAKSWLQAVGAE